MKNKLARFAALALTPVLLFGAPILARASTPTVIEIATVITPDEAVAVARAALNTDSPVRKVELETEHGVQVYDIIFVNGMRAQVDAGTSEVVRTRAEHRHDRDVEQRGDRHGDDRRATPAVPAPHVDDGAHNSSGTHVEIEVHGNPAEAVHGGGNSGGNSGRGNSGGGNSGRR